MGLTQKQEKFVLHYHTNGNAYKAYCHAYNAQNMKRETIDSRVSKMLKEYKISTRLSELRGEAQEIAQWGALEAFDELEALQVRAKEAKDLVTEHNILKSKISLMGVSKPVERNINVAMKEPFKIVGGEDLNTDD